MKQGAQLSQRDRAAGCVIVLAKSGRLELGDNISRTLQVYNRPENLSNSAKEKQNKGYYSVQGHTRGHPHQPFFFSEN